MNDIRISTLRLRNFKGIHSFDFEPSGHSAEIMGDNATGKTTVGDAFSWLLFGCDSTGRSDFVIKTLNEDGQAEHGLDHEVEGELLLEGGGSVTLKKVLREKWVKRRGEAKRTLTGHETNHFADGVPVTKGEYTARVAELADVDVFRLLTDPVHFSERLHWEERRKILLEVCGDVSDEDVIASDNALAELPELLGDRTIEDHRKVIRAQLAEINKELAMVPVRIDQESKGIPEISATEDDTRTALEVARDKRTEAEERRAGLATGGEMARLSKRIAEIETEILNAKNGARVDAGAMVVQDRKKLRALETALEVARGFMLGANDAGIVALADGKTMVANMVSTRVIWHEINETKFEFVGDPDTCPACGQSIPEFKLKAAREAALEMFNVDKAERLKGINQKGKEIAEAKRQLDADAVARQDAIAATKKTYEEAKAAVTELRQAIENVLTAESKTSPDIDTLTVERERIEERIAVVAVDTDKPQAEVAAEIAQFDVEIGEYESVLAMLEQRAAGEARIEGLKGDEKRLSGEFEESERQLFLTETFVRRKVEMLEEHIKTRFEMASFSMFRELINGEIEETAETTYGGVPWRNLNHGHRVRVGLDIIRTLQGHYGFAPPVWLDQGESVTSLPDMGCQMVRLVVSEKDKELRVQVGHGALSVAV